MKSIFKLLFFIYQWLIFMPIFVVTTILAALTTIALTSLSIKNPSILNLPAKLWSRSTCYLAFVLTSVEGMENLEKNTSYIFAANHQSAFDIWVIYGWLDRPFSWVMKKELRKVPFVGLACERIGHIFIDRNNPVAARKSMAEAVDILKNGRSVVIFPEGTRSKTGKTGNFKRGAFNMASDLQLPIVPITIVGAYERLSGSNFNPGKIKMIIHPPIKCNESKSEQEIKDLATKTREIIIEGLPK